ncbi:uncharacterized protein BDR25DRAFT_361061 [Lindgomyces ingoldianus]|uniref:Uncharacterized protein n=1 Tax=Lindgomyces ingoldianus TaxID=673940 RepID=A0ACB6QCZ8_9PLEO|nr:uncharacterized protein BDR25DRAFT_361061 [Lindgomyces ingoldianus]KAF2464833.1 hypothetical protein BDR25DRAFT_361061 [Lindgomyces ingoldianus]
MILGLVVSCAMIAYASRKERLLLVSDIHSPNAQVIGNTHLPPPLVYFPRLVRESAFPSPDICFGHKCSSTRHTSSCEELFDQEHAQSRLWKRRQWMVFIPDMERWMGEIFKRGHCLLDKKRMPQGVLGLKWDFSIQFQILHEKTQKIKASLSRNLGNCDVKFFTWFHAENSLADLDILRHFERRLAGAYCELIKLFPPLGGAYKEFCFIFSLLDRSFNRTDFNHVAACPREYTNERWMLSLLNTPFGFLILKYLSLLVLSA